MAERPFVWIGKLNNYFSYEHKFFPANAYKQQIRRPRLLKEISSNQRKAYRKQVLIKIDLYLYSWLFSSDEMLLIVMGYLASLWAKTVPK